MSLILLLQMDLKLGIALAYVSHVHALSLPPLCLSLSPFLSPPPSPLFNMQQRTESNYLAIGPGRAPHPALWLLMVSSHLQEDAGRQDPGLAEES